MMIWKPVFLIQPAPVSIPQCGLNEVYQSCEVDCIDCEHRGMCEPKNCHISHCDCKMYFVHVTPGGPCEHVSICPPRECPENEVYRHCGPYCEYCDMAQCRSMECSSKCYCKQGYRRNRETGKCVPEKECPERLSCFSNDAVAQSGLASEYCLETESEALRANETIAEEKCYCPSGFKRNVHGWCIEEELCSFVTCAEQTEFQDCPRKCNTTCWNYGDPNCLEDGQCYPGCFCAEGYVLNEFFACIPLEMCPPGSNPFVPTLPPTTVGPIPEPSLEETSESLATAESDSAAESSSSGSGSSSAAAGSSSSGSGSSSAGAESSSSGSGSSSAAAESSSSGTGSGSAAAAESSPGTESSSAAAAESSSAAATDSAAGSKSSSDVAEGTENTKESETEATTSEDETTEAPKKPPKKVTRVGKIYKSAARKGKTASPIDEEDA
ncbi:unnamed protein product [Larinioides sclopetarius]|uniref:TIL domain-containing protein n=1 Tax=Larinioides sclopetarius TaxID=280406 RepID=A0AAV2ACP6_9ARAC